MKRVWLVFMAFAVVGCGLGTPMHGEKIGTIIRVAHGGILCNTWEATLVRGGLNAGSGGFATQPFDFTITSEDMAANAQSLMEAQKEIKLIYRAEGIYNLCRSDSDGHFAEKIEVLQTPAKQQP